MSFSGAGVTIVPATMSPSRRLWLDVARSTAPRRYSKGRKSTNLTMFLINDSRRSAESPLFPTTRSFSNRFPTVEAKIHSWRK